MELKEFVFIGFVAATLLGAFWAVWLRNVFHNALALGFCFFGVAGIFIFLNAEFLAVMEVIIYIGAITIAIIFAIMLSQPMFKTASPRRPNKILRSTILAGLVFFAITKTLHNQTWPMRSIEGDYSIRAIGRSLLTNYALPFEAISLVLLVAIIGALVISGEKE
jgi:NADH-quinone oxidoreductase subunit J